MLTVELKNDYIEPFHIKLNKHYEEEVMFEGHKFHYAGEGLYKAVGRFELSKKQLEAILEKNPFACLLGIYKKGSYIDTRQTRKLKNDAKFTVYGACSVIYTDAFFSSTYERRLLADVSLIDIPKEAGGRFDADKDVFEYKIGDGWGAIEENAVPDEQYPFSFRFEPAERINGYKSYILFKKEGIFAFLVEEGIYKLKSSFQMDINTAFTYDGKPVAGIFHSTDFHPTMYAGLDYIAVGKEHFNRLKEIAEHLDQGWFHEFREEPVNFIPLNLLEIDEEMNQAFNSEMEGQDDEEYVEQIKKNGGKELFEGLGFLDINLEYRSFFEENHGIRTYKFAYILGHDLVLVSGNYKGKKEECRLDLRFLYYLIVNKTEKLDNGLEYPVMHTLIDCREEKLKELLTDEAYLAYVGRE